MDWKRSAGIVGGVGLFVAAVAIVGFGSSALVRLLSDQAPVAVPDRALLMERPQSLKPFDAPPPVAARAPAPEPAARRPPVVLTEPVARPPEVTALEPSSGGTDAAAEPAQPKAAPERQRGAVAALSPPPALERREARQPIVAVPPAAAPPDPVRRALTPPSLPTPPAPKMPEGMLTLSEIRRIKLSLRLSREQEPYWLPVEQLLRDIASQQEGMVRAGQNPTDAFGTGAAMRMYSAARPLLDILREDQKAQVRNRARAMGFGSIASSL